MRGLIPVLAIVSLVSASPSGLFRREYGCPWGPCKIKGKTDCCGSGVVKCGSDFMLQFEHCESAACKTDPHSGVAECF